MTGGGLDGTGPDAAPDPRIRSARPADADRLRELQSFLRQPNPDVLEYGLAVGDALVSVAERGAGGAGESDETVRSDHHRGTERVVGYLLPVDGPTRAGVHLAELAVAPTHRREGRARGLLAAVIADADGPVTLQAHPDNDGALALYDEFGFDVVGRRANAYPDGDALALRLD